MAEQHEVEGTHGDDERVDSHRRELFTKAGAAAAIAAVAGIGYANRAHAATGDPLRAGQSVSATSTDDTTLTGGTSFRVVNGTSSIASIYGTSSSGGQHGIYGSASGSSGHGVYGTSTNDTGAGVYGRHVEGGIGVYGHHASSSLSGTGILGVASVGTGIIGRGSTYDVLADQSGKIGLSKAGASSASSSGTVGTIARDSGGNLWYCYATNKWQRLGGPNASGVLHAIEPTRVYDSRRAATPNSGSFGSNSSRVISIKDARDLATGEVTATNIVPAGAKAITFNVTATLTTAASFLAVGSGDATEYTASSLNWFSGGATVGNATLVKLNSNREVTIFAGPFGQFDCIIDVTGYFL